MFFSLDAYRPEEFFELSDGSVAGDAGKSIDSPKRFENVDTASQLVMHIARQVRKLFSETHGGEYEVIKTLYRKTEAGYSFQLFIMQDNKRKVYEISTNAAGNFIGTFTEIVK